MIFSRNCVISKQSSLVSDKRQSVDSVMFTHLAAVVSFWLDVTGMRQTWQACRSIVSRVTGTPRGQAPPATPSPLGVYSPQTFSQFSDSRRSM